MGPVRTAAVLLRGYDYGDTSRILRFYTRDLGLLSVVGKGVRGRMGKGSTALSSFASGDLTAYVRPSRDLHTMKDFDCTRLRDGLGADVLRFGGASAAAELVLAHAEQERHPGLFEALEQALDRLDHATRSELPATILAALWRITGTFGFSPQLDPCIHCGAPLGSEEFGRFDLVAGGVRCATCGRDAAGRRIGPRARGQLDPLLRGDTPDELTHTRQHLGLVADFVEHHVVSRPLKSIRFLAGVFPPDSGPGDE